MHTKFACFAWNAHKRAFTTYTYMFVLSNIFLIHYDIGLFLLHFDKYGLLLKFGEYFKGTWTQINSTLFKYFVVLK